MKKKAYVFGSKVSESLSPLIFNYWFERAGINAEYSFKEINPKNFNKEIDLILSEKNICGFNVTIPFKELMISKIDNMDDHSRNIGAVNCVTKKKNTWIGRNTDWIGFTKPLVKHQENHNLDTKLTPVVIGYGGAAKAIIYALKKQGYKKIKIFNRTYEKIKHLNKDPQIQALRIIEIKKHLISNSLIINTTPKNILGDLNLSDLNKTLTGYDIVYSPKETMFLSHFKKTNRIYGINMLIHQAKPCFEEWFGKRPIIDEGLYSLLESFISK